mgnify:CR=1 FL=1
MSRNGTNCNQTDITCYFFSLKYSWFSKKISLIRIFWKFIFSDLRYTFRFKNHDIFDESPLTNLYRGRDTSQPNFRWGFLCDYLIFLLPVFFVAKVWIYSRGFYCFRMILMVSKKCIIIPNEATWCNASLKKLHRWHFVSFEAKSINQFQSWSFEVSDCSWWFPPWYLRWHYFELWWHFSDLGGTFENHRWHFLPPTRLKTGIGSRLPKWHRKHRRWHADIK